MNKKNMKVKVHGSYVGNTGYNHHVQGFVSSLSAEVEKVEVRNFSCDDNFELSEKDKNFIVEQTLTNEGQLKSYLPPWRSSESTMKKDVDIVLAETDHYYFYQDEEYEKPKIAYNVWESTLQPEGFFRKLLEFDQLWVPSNWQKNVSEAQGFPVEKIKVVPEGVDEAFRPSSSPNLTVKGVFRFLLLGRWDYRKSTTEILKAFQDLFGGDSRVELIVSIDNPFSGDDLSTEERLKKNGITCKNIRVLHFPSKRDYVDLIQNSHCHVSCSRSEGWGRTVHDSLACGTPTIWSDCSAQTEFAKGLGIPVRIFGEERAKDAVFLDSVPGNYFAPDFRDLKKKMQLVFENYEKLKIQALIDSIKIRKDFSWRAAGEAAASHLEELLKKPKAKTKAKIEECWATVCTKSFEPFAKIAVSRLAKFSDRPVFVFGVGFLPQIENATCLEMPKKEEGEKYPKNLRDKKMGVFYSKIEACIGVLNYSSNVCFFDADVIPLRDCDSIWDYKSIESDFPSFMAYFHQKIENWREVDGVRISSFYGEELQSSLDEFYDRRPESNISATGLFLFSKKHESFFREVLSVYDKIKKGKDLFDYVDDNAFSEERVSNHILWRSGEKIKNLPITWINKSNLEESKKNVSPENRTLINKGWDLIFDKKTGKDLFLHGPDPHFLEKTKQTYVNALEILDEKKDEETRLMVVAHPDDELIFGGNDLFLEDGWHVVFVTKPSVSRLKELAEAKKTLGYKTCEILGFEDGLDVSWDLTDLKQKLESIVHSKKWDKIVTHNPIGEYGHPQHFEVFEAMKSVCSDFFVFCKDHRSLPDRILVKKKMCLKKYASENSIIDQLLKKNGDWFLGGDEGTNYIDNGRSSRYEKNLDITEFVKCSDKTKGHKKKKKPVDKECILVVSYCNSPEKIEALEKCLKKLPENVDKCIYEHYPTPNDFGVEFKIFDKSNPIPSYTDRSITHWRNVEEKYVLHTPQIDYGYTVCQQIKRGTNFCFSVGYDIVHLLNYDILLEDQMLQRMSKNIEGVNLSYYIWGEDKSSQPNLCFASFRNSPEIREMMDTIDMGEYIGLPQGHFAEQYMHDKFKKIEKKKTTKYRDYEEGFKHLINYSRRGEPYESFNLKSFDFFLGKKNEEYKIVIYNAKENGKIHLSKNGERFSTIKTEKGKVDLFDLTDFSINIGDRLSLTFNDEEIYNEAWSEENDRSSIYDQE